MKYLTMVAVAVAMLAGTTLVSADEVKSGLQAGEFIGPFYVTKTAGAKEDGVKVGDNLCYRCKNGGRPQVMVFTRSSNDKVVELVQGLDKQISQNGDKQLKAFVNCLSENKAEAKEAAETLAASSKAKSVPFVVPNEVENGPDDYGINAKAEVTIIIASEGKVQANRAYTSGKDLDVKAVLADVEKMLK